MKTRCVVNGVERELEGHPLRRLLDVLREDLRLTGTKEGCGEGECGACTVLIDGEAVNSCLVPLSQVEGRDVRTIEALGEGGLPGDIQRALVDFAGTQCGICTPGIAMCAAAALEREPDASRERLRELLAGNLCRCTGYQLIVDAIDDVAARRRAAGAAPRPPGIRRAPRPAASGAPVARPATLAEALAARARHPDWLVVSGGTDVMVGAHRRPEPPGVLDLFGVAELAGVRKAGDVLRIGAGTTYAELLASPRVRHHLPCLHRACAEVGALQIQARGTLGGNMVTSSPVGDTLPCLLALDARVVVASEARGERRVPYHAFVTGYRQVDLRPDELLVAVEVPLPPDHAVQVWRKVGTRKAQAISKVMLAAVGVVEGGRVAHARVALGAVADRPVRLPAVEDLLVGQAPDEALAARAAEAVRATITPITDVRSTKEYRLDVAARLVAGFVRALAQDGRGGGRA